MLEVTERDRTLRRQRSGHDLSKGECQSIGVIGDPASPLHQIAMHESNQCDWTTESDCTQFEEVCGQRRQPNAGDLSRVNATHHCTSPLPCVVSHSNRCYELGDVGSSHVPGRHNVGASIKVS